MRETTDVTAATIRMIWAVGSRVANGMPDELAHLAELEATVKAARARAVEGLRRNGHTDVQIGEALGMTRQAVQARWPRTGELAVVGAGARYFTRAQPSKTEIDQRVDALFKHQ